MVTFDIRNNMLVAPKNIDEETIIPDQQVTDPILRLDMAKIETINSNGTRVLLRVLRAWEPGQIEFHNCSPSFVQMLNVIHSFLGRPRGLSRVVSLYLPYFCPKCGAEENHHYRLDEVTTTEGEPMVPEHICSSCGGHMELDCEEEEYFEFSRIGAQRNVA